MSIIINTNRQSLFAQRAINQNTYELSKETQKLSTGKKINKAADDAAGLSITQSMESEIRGYKMAKQNIPDGISLIQTLEGNMTIIADQFQRIRELMVQAANGTNSQDELDAMQREVVARTQTVSDMIDAAQYNGRQLIGMNTSGTNAFDISIQTGFDDNHFKDIVFRADASTQGNGGIEITMGEPTGDPNQFGEVVENVTTNNFALEDFYIAGSNVNSLSGNNLAITLDDMSALIDNMANFRSYLVPCKMLMNHI